MSDSANPSNPDHEPDAPLPPDLDFELPIGPRWWSDPPRGSWEAGYELSLLALAAVKDRPEIWAQRAAQMVNVEFVM
jgi:hypothetical protein